MSESANDNSVGMGAMAYERWCTYWTKMETNPPSIHLSKYTMKGGVLFLAPISREEMDPFIESTSTDSDFIFFNEGESQIREHAWFGNWCGFSAHPKPMRKIAVYPKPVKRMPVDW